MVSTNRSTQAQSHSIEEGGGGEEEGKPAKEACEWVIKEGNTPTKEPVALSLKGNRTGGERGNGVKANGGRVRQPIGGERN